MRRTATCRETHGSRAPACAVSSSLLPGLESTITPWDPGWGADHMSRQAGTPTEQHSVPCMLILTTTAAAQNDSCRNNIQITLTSHPASTSGESPCVCAREMPSASSPTTCLSGHSPPPPVLACSVSPHPACSTLLSLSHAKAGGGGEGKRRNRMQSNGFQILISLLSPTLYSILSSESQGSLEKVPASSLGSNFEEL